MLCSFDFGVWKLVSILCSGARVTVTKFNITYYKYFLSAVFRNNYIGTFTFDDFSGAVVVYSD